MCLSMMAFFILQLRPTSTLSMMTDSSTSAQLRTITLYDSTELRTVAPLMMHPCETMESTALPIRGDLESGWLKTNLAGGNWRWCVRIGQRLP